jgi:hypothetical protein
MADTPVKKVVQYELIRMESSFCPHCHKNAMLLCPANIADMEENPSFGVCFDCHFIGQIGVGQIIPQEIPNEQIQEI